jgi:hypothetical protein
MAIHQFSSESICTSAVREENDQNRYLMLYRNKKKERHAIFPSKSRTG